MDASISIVAYLALFASVGLLFLFVNLLVGSFVRPNNPHPEKLEIYECGEPTIGSSFVQFDLRFYVVALVFIVFDVEVAFLFPWATVFGKTHNLADERFDVVAVSTDTGQVALTPGAQAAFSELGITNATLPATADSALMESQIRAGARDFTWFAAGAMGIFFVVLLIGFAYEWKTGAFDWVRAVSRERNLQTGQPTIVDPIMEEEFLSV
jgi:NADH-quinone oxidoreductase subunit A